MSEPTIVFQDEVLPDHALAIIDIKGERRISLYRDNQPILTVDQGALIQLIDHMVTFRKVAAQVAMTPYTESAPVETHSIPVEVTEVAVEDQEVTPERDYEQERLNYEAEQARPSEMDEALEEALNGF
jgi:hypothetical protein